MTLFESLYGHKCRTPINWDRVEDKVLVGPNILKEMEEQMVSIKAKLKEVADRQKSYVDKNKTF